MAAWVSPTQLVLKLAEEDAETINPGISRPGGLFLLDDATQHTAGLFAAGQDGTTGVIQFIGVATGGGYTAPSEGRLTWPDTDILGIAHIAPDDYLLVLRDTLSGPDIVAVPHAVGSGVFGPALGVVPTEGMPAVSVGDLTLSATTTGSSLDGVVLVRVGGDSAHDHWRFQRQGLIWSLAEVYGRKESGSFFVGQVEAGSQSLSLSGPSGVSFDVVRIDPCDLSVEEVLEQGVHADGEGPTTLSLGEPLSLGERYGVRNSRLGPQILDVAYPVLTVGEAEERGGFAIRARQPGEAREVSIGSDFRPEIRISLDQSVTPQQFSAFLVVGTSSDVTAVNGRVILGSNYVVGTDLLAGEGFLFGISTLHIPVGTPSEPVYFQFYYDTGIDIVLSEVFAYEVRECNSAATTLQQGLLSQPIGPNSFEDWAGTTGCCHRSPQAVAALLDRLDQ